MKDYIRREIKFLLYLAIIFFVVLFLIPMLGGQKPVQSADQLFREKRMMIFLGLILAYSLAYPLIAFKTVKRYLNGSYSDNRDAFDKAFSSLNFVKTVDTPEKIVYRKKSGFSRFIQWGEDKVVIDPRDNPVTLSGLRKNVVRIDSMIDQYLRNE